MNATHNGTHSTHKAQSRVSPHCMVINKMYIDAMGLLTVKHAMMSLWAGTGIQKPRVKSNVKYWAGASPPQKQQKYRVGNWGGGHLLTLVLYIYLKYTLTTNFKWRTVSACSGESTDPALYSKLQLSKPQKDRPSGHQQRAVYKASPGMPTTLVGCR